MRCILSIATVPENKTQVALRESDLVKRLIDGFKSTSMYNQNYGENNKFILSKEYAQLLSIAFGGDLDSIPVSLYGVELLVMVDKEFNWEDKNEIP